ncbi:MAG: MFS transporter [Pseudomonadota bacterium]
MIALLTHPVFSRLFAAQVFALLGTGLLTVALGLLAFDLAEGRAGSVLGTALTIKMLAYVGLAPVAQALSQHLPRRTVLVASDIVRGAVALCLPFVSEIWHIYALIFLLQAASATFTPTFQGLLPDVLPDEAEYTRGLALSRIAYEIENLASPLLAGFLLFFVSYNGLFVGTSLGFAASALLILSTRLPSAGAAQRARSFADRLTRGIRIYLATPRLRGLLALTLLAAASSSFVFVNTVVVVRDLFSRSEGDLALALAAFGAGAMITALALPGLLEHRADRPVMMAGGIGLVAQTLTIAVGLTLGMDWVLLLMGYFLMGFWYSLIVTPAGRLLRRSAHAEDRPAIFAAQFALSHACYLLCYPLAGWSGVALGLGPSLGLMGLVGVVACLASLKVWPKTEAGAVAHDHPDLPANHPHLREHGAEPHSHPVVIDDEHPVWPVRG